MSWVDYTLSTVAKTEMLLACSVGFLLSVLRSVSGPAQGQKVIFPPVTFQMGEGK